MFYRINLIWVGISILKQRDGGEVGVADKKSDPWIEIYLMEMNSEQGLDQR